VGKKTKEKRKTKHKKNEKKHVEETTVLSPRVLNY
jgi:hypothetical protein